MQLSQRRDARRPLAERLKEEIMEWTTPQFEEISLNCEINSYANAEL
jgi:coenzyme PQQ precursor peptide PqqA